MALHRECDEPGGAMIEQYGLEPDMLGSNETPVQVPVHAEASDCTKDEEGRGRRRRQEWRMTRSSWVRMTRRRRPRRTARSLCRPLQCRARTAAAVAVPWQVQLQKQNSQ